MRHDPRRHATFVRAAAWFAVLLAFVVLVALIVSPKSQAAVPTTTAPCPQTLVLAVDGTKGAKTPTSIDPESPLNPIAAEAGLRYGAPVEHIAYPGGIIAGIKGWTHDYDDSVEIGKSALRQRIFEQETRCPATQYVFLGYSQGARVVGDVLAEIDSDYGDEARPLRERSSAVLYSDPRQPGTGVEVRFPGRLLPGITLQGERPPFEHIPVEWVCIPYDGVCDMAGFGDGGSLGSAGSLGSVGIVESLLGYLIHHTEYTP